MICHSLLAIVHSGMAVTGATDSSRLLAALSLGEEDRSRILDASRALAEAMAALLNASRPENYNKVVILKIWWYIV